MSGKETSHGRAEDLRRLQVRSGRTPRGFVPLFLLVFAGFFLVAPRTRADLLFDSILEWNGPYFRVLGAETVDQAVDVPAVELPFAGPLGLAAREHGAGERDVVYVVDSGNNRVQAFEVNAAYHYDNRSTFTWQAGGISPAASEYDHNQILAAEWAAVSDRWIVPFSEVVEIDGVAWRRVEDLTGFTPVDHVYTVRYDDATEAPELLFPDNSLSETSTFYLRYAMTENRGALPDAFGIGDVDFGLSPAEPKVLVEIDPTSGGPSSWQRVRSVTLSENDALASTDDLFLLDAADNSVGQNEELFYFSVNAAGAVTYGEAYDDVLTYPCDVAVARSGASSGAGVTMGDDMGAFDQAGASIRDASQVTGHTYAVVVAAGNVTVVDQTTGRVLTDAAPFAELANPYLAIPGISLDKNGLVGVSNQILTTAALPRRYLFVADTGDHRIKVVTAHGATPDAIDDWLPGDIHVLEAQPSGAGQVGATADHDYYQTTPGTVPQGWSGWTAAFPVKEGTLATITFDPGGVPDLWTRVDELSTQDPTAKVYSVDWTTGRILFGDETHGAVPPASQEFSYSYATSPDLLRYGSAGTGEARFRNPRGVAARWNSSLGAYDVYVADSGNHRMQKLAFHPPDPALNLPARMDFVAEWNGVSSALDTLKSPMDVVVSVDGSSPPVVHLAVSDQGNKRLVLYTDVAAGAGGGTAAPSFVTVLGGPGNTLGSYQKPAGLAFLANGEDLDLFAADSTRGVVTKYKEAPSPSISLSYAGASVLPECFPPSGTYPFSFSTVNPPDGGWVDFYFDTSSTFNISTSKLCITSATVPATSSSAAWVFAETPHTPPPARAPEDGFYYLFARLKDADGNVVASDLTPAERLLCLDSDLSPTLHGADAIDGDVTLYLQNGLDRILNLQVSYPESVMAVGFSGTFDTTLVEIRSISPGDGWNDTGAIAQLFNESHSNRTGIFQVNTSATGTPFGLNGTGPYTLARIALRAKPWVLSPAQRFRNGTLSLVQATCGLTRIDGSTPSTWRTENINLRLGYLADIATTGTGADGAVPHLSPRPDGIIDFADQMAFTLGWNGAANAQDRISDLAPAGGVAPDLLSNPDGYWNVEDLLAFTTMFSWATGEEGYRSGRPAPLGGVAYTPARARTGGLLRIEAGEGEPRLRVLRYPPEAPAGTEVSLELFVEGARDLCGARLLLAFDPADLRPAGAEPGEFLPGREGALFFHRSGAGWIEALCSRLDRAEPGRYGDGRIARLRFIALRENPAPTEMEFELYSSTGALLARGLAREDLPGVAEADVHLNASPNPTRGASDILLSLPSSRDVRLDLFDVNGRRVRTLLEEAVPKGWHTIHLNGRDDEGRILGSGVYVYTLRSGAQVTTRKLVLVR